MEAAAVQRISANREPIVIVVAGAKLNVALRPRPRCTVSPLLNMHIQGEIDGAPAHVFMPTNVFDWCLDRVGPSLSAAKLDAQTAALVFEAALAELFDTLETLLGAKITIRSAALSAQRQSGLAHPDLMLRAEFVGRPPFPIDLYVPADVARKALVLWSGHAENTAATDPNITLAVRVGLVRLTRAERDGLAAGDLLLLDDSPLLQKEVCLVADETLGAMASLSGRQIRLQTALSPFEDGWIGRYALRGFGREPLKVAALGSDPRAASAASQEANYVLTVELARRAIPYSQLEKIDLNQSFELPQGIDGVMDLYAGTQRIGNGRLVMAGGQFGLRILGLERHA